jgi:hypothetical protein
VASVAQILDALVAAAPHWAWLRRGQRWLGTKQPFASVKAAATHTHANANTLILLLYYHIFIQNSFCIILNKLLIKIQCYSS